MSNWTEQRVNRLTFLWKEGSSASEIAKELGGISRNSVIGKATRLGLTGKRANASQSDSRASSAAQKINAAHKKPKLSGASALVVAARIRPPSPPAARNEPSRAACSILDLKFDSCRWIIGDSRKPLDPIYCGQRTADGVSFCGYHSRIAYMPAQERQRKKARAA